MYVAVTFFQDKIDKQAELIEWRERTNHYKGSEGFFTHQADKERLRELVAGLQRIERRLHVSY